MAEKDEWDDDIDRRILAALILLQEGVKLAEEGNKAAAASLALEVIARYGDLLDDETCEKLKAAAEEYEA